MIHWIIFVFLLKILCILERREGGRKRGRETSMWERYSNQLPLSCPQLGTSLQPKHVPWLGIEPVAFHLAGQDAIHWATPARPFLKIIILVYSITVVPIFPLCPPLSHPIPHSCSPSLPHCPCPLIFQTCSLIIPFTSCHRSPTPFPLSVWSLFPCLWFCFAH